MQNEDTVIVARESAWRLAWWIKAIFTGGIWLIFWGANKLVVTTRRVYLTSGTFSKKERSIPLGRVQDVSLKQGMVGRMFGYGDLRIESAGGATTEIVAKGYGKAARVRSALLERMQ